MIRLIIAAIAVFLIWVLFASGFSKNRKIAIVVAGLVISVVGIWYESTLYKPDSGVVPSELITSCGVVAKHSYRTNFDFQLCLKNQSETGYVKRVSLNLLALRCDADSNCVELQQVARDLAIDLPPNSQTVIEQNLSFSEVSPAMKDIVWILETVANKATKASN